MIHLTFIFDLHVISLSCVFIIIWLVVLMMCLSALQSRPPVFNTIRRWETAHVTFPSTEALM